ncbi:dTDP-glucose 4,6-dehydratase [Candidatus Woesearchaeota archaeon]|nr:dTDP-glucose 4,6-dehydratase [Candidatus Woesearchaeota archaeon]
MAVKFLITGGAGFIGSNFIRLLLQRYPDGKVINLDKLTYAGNLNNLKDIENDPRYEFLKGDICDEKIVEKACKGVDIILNFAAESHVDRSISGPAVFIKTDMMGTQVLLDAVRKFKIKRFIQVSTDEVYGSIQKGSFKESDNLMPSSPYSASKAAADLLVHAYIATYKVPAIIVRSTNNFGPYQYPEKMIPLFVTNLLQGKKVPVYGDGLNVRDWIYVLDNCEAILHVVENGELGGIYNIGGGNEKRNIDITRVMLRHMGKGEEVIEYVKDRPGHDLRYSLDCDKIHALGWKPRHSFEKALKETIDWYSSHQGWWKPLKEKV